MSTTRGARRLVDVTLASESRQLVLLREMLNNANTTADVTPEDMKAEAEELVAPNAKFEQGVEGAGNSTVELPEEEAGLTLRKNSAIVIVIIVIITTTTARPVAVARDFPVYDFAQS